MSRFRTNHDRGSSTNVAKIGLFALVLGVLAFFFGSDSLSGLFEESETTNEPTAEPDEDIFYLPTGGVGQVVRHRYYTLSYDEEAEQAEWVAYELTRERLYRPNVERTNDFREDPLVSTGTASWDDYLHSGYDRGHLAPAGDMNFAKSAMSESFFMSNISPQNRAFNGGAWRELEENVRDWARENKKLYVVTGPDLRKPPLGIIGRNTRVSVPAAYFKVLLDLTEPDYKAIGFYMPNEKLEEPLYEFAMSVDMVERVTGLDFFGDLLEPDLEQQLESRFEPDDWGFDQRRFERRVYEWNLRE